jgi:hypothetical protein
MERKMRLAIAIMIISLTLGCTTIQQKRYEEGKQRIANGAEEYCPKVAVGSVAVFGVTDILMDLFGSEEEELDDVIARDTLAAVSALCIMLQAMDDQDPGSTE